MLQQAVGGLTILVAAMASKPRVMACSGCALGGAFTSCLCMWRMFSVILASLTACVTDTTRLMVCKSRTAAVAAGAPETGSSEASQ